MIHGVIIHFYKTKKITHSYTLVFLKYYYAWNLFFIKKKTCSYWPNIIGKFANGTRKGKRSNIGRQEIIYAHCNAITTEWYFTDSHMERLFKQVQPTWPVNVSSSWLIIVKNLLIVSFQFCMNIQKPFYYWCVFVMYSLK